MRSRANGGAIALVRGLRSLARATLWLVAAAPATLAQDTQQVRPVRGDVTYVGSDAEDRARLAQLLGEATTAGWMIRSASSEAPRLDSTARGAPLGRMCVARWSTVRPSADLTWNSALPYERNDDGVWAGRGTTLHAIGGARAACGRVRVQLAPEVWYARNRAFAMLGGGSADRSGFASPFFAQPAYSADLPVRFGGEPLFVVEPGQTSVEVDVPWLTLGAGTESQWWGPARRNALLMSNHAAGIPAVYARTTKPVRTPLGLAEARWMVGALTESRFFDFDTRNDLRSLSGLVITSRMPFDTTLTIGWARVVFAPVPGAGALPARFLDAVARWGEGANVRAATEGRAADQLMELFARWVFPASGFEAYAEWARVLLPSSFRALLQSPQTSQGYTAGLQWVSGPASLHPAWRIESEITDLEQLVVSRAVPAPTFYVSPTVPQGYTQRGQVIGAMIGPGSSSQWVAVDRLTAEGRIGMFIGRTRWQNDAFYRAPTGLSVWAHDVSLTAGVRGARSLRVVDASAELVLEKRMNYLFQSATFGFSPDRTFDVNNLSLKLSFAPPAAR